MHYMNSVNDESYIMKKNDLFKITLHRRCSFSLLFSSMRDLVSSLSETIRRDKYRYFISSYLFDISLEIFLYHTGFVSK